MPHRPTLLLILILLACLPPLLVDLGRRDVTRIMENISVLSTQETFLRMHGADQIPREDHAWLMPTAYGRPRLNKPPMMVWCNLLAFSDLTPETSTPDQLAWRMRLVSVAMTLLLIGSTFWIGRILQGVELGSVAAAAVAMMWFVQRQGRTASFDIHLAAWATLSVAAGMTVMWGKLQIPNSKLEINPNAQGSGVDSDLRFGVSFGFRVWSLGFLSSLALGFAILTKGPLAYLLVIPPLLIAAPRRWKWILLITLIGTLIAAPWYALAITRHADALGSLWHEYKLERTEHQPFYYYLGLLGLILPWSLWFIGGLAFPWARKDSPLHPASIFAFGWFIFLFVAFSIPVAKHQRYILPIVPAAGLLIGIVLVDHAMLLKADPRFRGDRWLRLIHQLAMSIVGVALPFALFEPRESWGLAPLTPVLAVALMAVLLLISLLGWSTLQIGPLDLRRLGRNPYWFAAAATIWMSVVMTAVWHCADTHQRPGNIFRQAAAQVAPLIAGKPLGYLDSGGRSAADWHDLEEFHFHLRRITPILTPETLPAFQGLIAALATGAQDKAMETAGYKRIADFAPQPEKIHRLWTK